MTAFALCRRCEFSKVIQLPSLLSKRTKQLTFENINLRHNCLRLVPQMKILGSQPATQPLSKLTIQLTFKNAYLRHDCLGLEPQILSGHLHIGRQVLECCCRERERLRLAISPLLLVSAHVARAFNAFASGLCGRCGSRVSGTSL